MKIVRLHRQYPDQDLIQLAVDILERGGVVVHATDTCYGLAVDIHNPLAIAKLYALKQMSPTKPTSVIVHNEAMLQQYAKVDKPVENLIKEYWPGPLTIILPKGGQVPDHYNQGHDMIGVRRPKCEVSLQLVGQLGRPITTTSANISGQPEAYSVFDLCQQFAHLDLKPDLVLDGGDLDRNTKPSTIIQIQPAGFKVIRQGEIKINDWALAH